MIKIITDHGDIKVITPQEMAENIKQSVEIRMKLRQTVDQLNKAHEIFSELFSRDLPGDSILLVNKMLEITELNLLSNRDYLLQRFYKLYPESEGKSIREIFSEGE